MPTIAQQPTIEVVEALASALESEGEARRSRLMQFIGAYARMIACSSPEAFKAAAMVRELRELAFPVVNAAARSHAG